MGDGGWLPVFPALRIQAGHFVGTDLGRCWVLVGIWDCGWGWKGRLRLFRMAVGYLVVDWEEFERVFGGRLEILGDGYFLGWREAYRRAVLTSLLKSLNFEEVKVWNGNTSFVSPLSNSSFTFRLPSSKLIIHVNAQSP